MRESVKIDIDYEWCIRYVSWLTVLSMAQTVKGNDGFSDRGINTFNDLPKNKIVQTEHIQHRSASAFASVCDLYDTYAAMQGSYMTVNCVGITLGYRLHSV